ncbi:hypothetical protein [Promicromonospora sp. NPDC057488]|uniref:hypothetical protein n=1 Tax=Promicromonospora sp. NPDC057488 TaxID=3346147 RepID=UPI003671A4FC
MLDVLIGAVVAIGCAALGVWATLRAARPRRPEPKVVSMDAIAESHGREKHAPAGLVIISQESSIEYANDSQRLLDSEQFRPDLEYLNRALLDIKLMNSGGGSAFLTAVILSIDHVTRIPRFSLPPIEAVSVLESRLAPQALYGGVRLPAPLAAPGARVTVPISHVIAPDEGDRFQIEVGVGTPDVIDWVYMISVEMQHGAEHKRIAGPKVAFAFEVRRTDSISPRAMKSAVDSFFTEVRDQRKLVEQAAAARGEKLDWGQIGTLSKNRRRYDGDLLPAFWQPRAAVNREIDLFEESCQIFLADLGDSHTLPSGLKRVRHEIEACMAKLPDLRAYANRSGKFPL